MAEKFAENLRSARVSARKTASQCADSLGCTVAAWSQWESGKREPKYSVLLDICLLLETSPNELLGFEIPTPEPTVINNITQNINPPSKRKARK